MRRSLLVGALLIGVSSMSSAAEVHIDEHTLCPVALRAVDETDLPAIEEFLRFVQGVFDELNARYTRIRKKLHPQQNSLARAWKCLLYWAFAVSVPSQLFIRRQHILITQCTSCELP